MPPDQGCRLYLITPDKIPDVAAFAQTLAQTLAAGDVACVQLRLKNVDDATIQAAAETLMPVCHQHEVAFILNDLALVIWGGDTLTVPVPDALLGAFNIGSLYYPKYRLFVLALGLLVFAGLWLLLNRTRLGALIRAGVDDPETIEALGIDIRKVFLGTFMLGAALAGLGGAVGGAFLTLYPSADSEILVFSLAVVIIGGRGSLAGAAVGALVVGLLNSIGQVMFPELAYFAIFGPMAVLLAFRPLGLFGKAA